MGGVGFSASAGKVMLGWAGGGAGCCNKCRSEKKRQKMRLEFEVGPNEQVNTARGQ